MRAVLKFMVATVGMLASRVPLGFAPCGAPDSGMDPLATLASTFTESAVVIRVSKSIRLNLEVLACLLWMSPDLGPVRLYLEVVMSASVGPCDCWSRCGIGCCSDEEKLPAGVVAMEEQNWVRYLWPRL